MKIVDTLETGLLRVETPENVVDGDAAIVDLLPRLAAAHTAVLAAREALEEADRFYASQRPRARALLRVGHGVARATRQGQAVEMSRWKKADALARRIAGLCAAERAVSQAEERQRRLVVTILGCRATTLSAMALKLRLCRLDPTVKVMDSIETDLAALGLMPAVSP
jgi:hypothetical protein